MKVTALSKHYAKDSLEATFEPYEVYINPDLIICAFPMTNKVRLVNQESLRLTPESFEKVVQLLKD